MNWKLVAALFVGSSLVAACGASSQEAAAPSDTRTNAVDTPGGGNGTIAPATVQPPAAKPAATEEAKKPIVVHD